MITAVAKQYPGKDMDPLRHAGLRAVSRTVIQECPAALRQSLESTLAAADGAVVWTPDNPTRKDYSTATAEWISLSVLHTLCNSHQPRDIQKVFQVPSVHIELESTPTYMACSKCFKAWAETEYPPCSCWPRASEDARVPR